MQIYNEETTFTITISLIIPTNIIHSVYEDLIIIMIIFIPLFILIIIGLLYEKYIAKKKHLPYSQFLIYE
jgi:hypothetical protein